MNALAAAGAGFLLAVLWFDLMFDVQVFGHRERELPEAVLASIAGYYRRVTTTAQPMTFLIGAVMLVTLVALVAQIVDGDVESWVAWSSLGLAAIAIGIAGVHTVPSAVRLGARSDSAERQSALARSICRDHLVCIVAIAAVLLLQVIAA